MGPSLILHTVKWREPFAGFGWRTSHGLGRQTSSASWSSLVHVLQKGLQAECAHSRGALPNMDQESAEPLRDVAAPRQSQRKAALTARSMTIAHNARNYNALVPQRLAL